jgi:hypothetical protein
MTPPRDPDRLISAFLAEGPAELPDRAYDAVRAHIDRTRQRVVIGPWREPRMPILARVAIAAAAVLIVGVIGVNLLGGRGPTVGGPPSASPSPMIASSAVALPAASLDPGTTYRIDDRCCVVAPLTLTIPGADWFAIDPAGILGKNAIADPAGYYDVAVSTWRVENVYTDVCHWRGKALDPVVGPSAQELAAALVDAAGPDATGPTDLSLGGYPAKKVVLPAPSGVDVSTCDEEKVGRWSTPTEPAAGYPHTYGAGQTDVVYVVDVAGRRQVLHAMYLPGTSDANLAELDQVIQSIRFQP